jgi:hypothetical protein
MFYDALSLRFNGDGCTFPIFSNAKKICVCLRLGILLRHDDACCDYVHVARQNVIKNIIICFLDSFLCATLTIFF